MAERDVLVTILLTADLGAGKCAKLDEKLPSNVPSSTVGCRRTLHTRVLGTDAGVYTLLGVAGSMVAGCACRGALPSALRRAASSAACAMMSASRSTSKLRPGPLAAVMLEEESEREPSSGASAVAGCVCVVVDCCLVSGLG